MGIRGQRLATSASSISSTFRTRGQSEHVGSLRAVREFLRGAIRLHVLHHAAEDEINGAWMADELARHGYKISPGTLYPTLHRMEEEGLLESRKDVRNGRAIRLYRATDLGRGALDEERDVLAELAHEVLGVAPASPRRPESRGARSNRVT